MLPMRTNNLPDPSGCLFVQELAQRWRTRVGRIRDMIRAGQLNAITIAGRIRVTPEAVRQAEAFALAVRPKVRRRREVFPAEVSRALADDGSELERGSE
jgi:hypothetical protein